MFEWDAANREHIRRHGVGPQDAEEAWLDPDQVPAEVSHLNGGEWRDSVIGMTRSGRLLYVAWSKREGRIRIFLARKPTPQEARVLHTLEAAMRYEDLKPDDFYQPPQGTMVVVNSWDEVPSFEDEGQAAAFWETHTLTDHLWSKRRGLSPAARRYLASHPEAERPRISTRRVH